MRPFAFLLTVGLALLLMPVHAQDKSPEVVVTHAITQETPDGLNLQVYFTVRDKEGRPVSPAKINAGKMILREDRTPDIVTLTDPNTPIKIALVLDASGSMVPVAEQLRNAAIDSIDKAPPEAEIGVFNFSDVSSTDNFALGLDFTADREAVKQYIRTQYNPQNLAPTCLYNVAYRTAQLLQTTLPPEERRSIILFTDGKDDRGSNLPCSDRSLEDAIRVAAPDQGATTPIYTIGLCRNANDCSNLDEAVLQRMATQTNAGFVTGGREQLTSAFFQIMDDIRSQKMASVTVLTCEEGQATLAVSVIGIGDDIKGVVPFPANHACYAPTATAALSVLNQDEKKYDFLLDAKNTSPVVLKQFEIKVLAPNNTLVYSTTVNHMINPRQSTTQIPIQVPVDNFKQDGQYTLQAFAFSDNAIPFRAENDKERRNLVLAQYTFDYQPPIKQVQIAIKSPPQILYDQGILTINEIKITDNDDLLKNNKKFIKYQLTLLDGETTIHQWQTKDFNVDKPEINVALAEIPETLIPKEKPRRYNIRIKLFAPNIDIESESFSFDFPVQQKQSIFEKYRLYFLAGLVLAIGIATIVLLMRRRQSRPLAVPKPQIYTSQTGMLDSSMVEAASQRPAQQAPPQRSRQQAQPQPSQTYQVAEPTAMLAPVIPLPTSTTAAVKPQLRLRIVTTPNQHQQREHVIITFPCTIGRNQTEDVTIDGDKSVSRHHAVITHKDGYFFISDADSNYGIYIDRTRQQQHKPIKIITRTRIKIGELTEIELEPL